MDPRTDTEVRDILAAALQGTLTKQHVERLAAIDVELLKLALLTAAKRVAEQHAALNQKDARIAELEDRLRGPATVHPSTPSSQRPVYTKPPAPKRKRKPGARKGHPGVRRPEPEQIDLRQEHRLDVCPDCGGPLQSCSQVRTRTIEDILEDLRTLVTEHTIHRDYCPKCRKPVEPVVLDALAKRLLRHCDELFTFLDYPDVPFDNNLAERMIRPAVLLRRNCQCNRSERGAAVQSVLMSVYRTLKLRGHDPLGTVVEALRTYAATGVLPSLPQPIPSRG